MRSYTANFFDVARFTTDLCHNTNSWKQRLVDALLLALTIIQVALMITHEISGFSVLGLCAEILDGIESIAERKLLPSMRG